MRIKCPASLILIFMLSLAIAEGEESKNIIPDGGFEKVRVVVVAYASDIYKAIRQGVNFGREGPVVILPSNFWGFAGTPKKLIVVEGKPGKEVHSGKRAIFISGKGGFYFKGAQCNAKTGDIFKARFYAKGKGKVRLILHLTNIEGKYYSQAVPQPVSLDTDKWTLIEQTLDTSGKPDLKRIWVRVESEGDLYIDDVSLVKEEK